MLSDWFYITPGNSRWHTEKNHNDNRRMHIYDPSVFLRKCNLKIARFCFIKKPRNLRHELVRQANACNCCALS